MYDAKLSFSMPGNGITFSAAGSVKLVSEYYNDFMNNFDKLKDAAEILAPATQNWKSVKCELTSPISDWSEAIQAIKHGTAVFHVGDKFKMELLNGKKVTMVITDETKDAYRFESRECLGIETSANDLNGFLIKVWEQFPPNIKKYVINVIRRVENKDGTVSEIDCYVFVPAASEIFDEDDCYGKDIYKQLEWYKDIRNRIRMVEDGSKEAHWYWTSSPYSDNSNDFCPVISNGNADHVNASYTRGLAPFGCWISKS